MTFCKTYDEARLVIINAISDFNTYDIAGFNIIYIPNDLDYPYRVEKKKFSINESCEILKI